MEHKDFITILRKYRQGEATPEEKNLIDAWYASIGTHVYNQDTPDNIELGRSWRTVYAHVKNSKKNGKTKESFPWYSMGIAASVLIMIIACLITVDHRQNENTNKREPSVSWKYVANLTQMPQAIVLPDSSTAILKPKSNLKFSTVFNKTEREIYLEGEASFDVAHNAKLPFLVYANEVTTKVLGTSFIVRAVKHEQTVTVTVKTGKVSVYTNPKKEIKQSPANVIILTPNQRIVYDKKENEISKMLVEAPQVILPVEEVRQMRFEGAPVTEILKALEKAYGVDIEFNEAIFSSCELTTVISNDDIYSRLNIICNTIGASYTLQEDRIVMNSSGCKVKME
jgi:transmembrane sensor